MKAEIVTGISEASMVPSVTPEVVAILSILLSMVLFSVVVLGEISAVSCVIVLSVDSSVGGVEKSLPIVFIVIFLSCVILSVMMSIGVAVFPIGVGDVALTNVSFAFSHGVST